MQERKRRPSFGVGWKPYPGRATSSYSIKPNYYFGSDMTLCDVCNPSAFMS